jgi:O-antigen ligase
MRILLVGLLLFMTLSQTFEFDPGPAPGLKIRNLIMYLLLLGLVLRFTSGRGFRLQQPAVPILFSVLIGYAMLTYVLIILMIDYPRYDMITSGMVLKNSLIDQFLGFLVFFYGCRTDKDALLMVKVLLGCWALVHVMAVLSAVGLVHVGDMAPDEEGRVQGAIGEPNQYAAFVASSLPAILALMATGRGVLRKLFWAAAAIAAAAALLLTISRGGYLSTILAGLAGLILFWRYLPGRKLATWAGIAIVGAVILVGVIWAVGFGDAIIDRVFGHMETGGLGEASSGRTEVWTAVMKIMFEHPITLLTGFGWEAYRTFPFRFATHNHYLELWFNLGLVGLIGGMLLLAVPARIAYKSFSAASAEVRALLGAFVVGSIAMAIAVFFVNLYSPWHYWYCYVGVMMRLAQNAVERPASEPVVVPAQRAVRAAPAHDPHGWSGASARGRAGVISR